MMLCEVTRGLGRLGMLRRFLHHKATEESGLYFGQLPLLEYVAEHDGCTQRELAEEMRVSPPSIATSVKRLQKSELLSKRSDPDDLRYTRLSITPKGREAAEKCRRCFDAVDAHMLDGISEEEQTVFSGILARMIRNLSVGELKDLGFFELIEKMDQLSLNEAGETAKGRNEV